MKGSKTKLGTKGGVPKWRLRVFVGRDAEGRQQFATKTYVGSAREADRELSTMVDHAHPGGSASSGDARKRTLGAALTLWRVKDAPRKSPPTVRGYESNLAKHVLDELGSVPVNRITPRILAELFERLSSSGLKPATVNNVHTAISAVLSRAVREGWLAHNPAQAIRRAPIAWRPPTAPEHDELAKLLLAVDDEDERTLVLLAVATGARRGELAALRWSDLDRRRGKLTIERALVVGKAAGAGLVEKDTKTHATRSNLLAQYALDELDARRARAESYAKTCGVKLAADGFVFSDDPRGLVPWRPDWITHRWMRVRDRAGLGSVRFHDLRHFAVSEALARGHDPVSVRDHVGHRSLDTTNLYAHSREGAEAELAAADDEAMRALVAR